MLNVHCQLTFKKKKRYICTTVALYAKLAKPDAVQNTPSNFEMISFSLFHKVALFER